MEPREEYIIRMQDSGTDVVIEDVISFNKPEKMNYCRLCATVDNDAIQIFGKEGTQMKLADKINSSLPIWVSSNMGPPLVVCKKCIMHLNATAIFIQQVIAAQKKISSVFKVLQDLSEQSPPTAWNKDCNKSTLFTYYRSRKHKRKGDVSQSVGSEDEKGDEGNNRVTSISAGSVMPQDTLRPSRGDDQHKEKMATSSVPCIHLSGDQSVEGDDFEKEFDGSDEDDHEASAPSNGTSLINIMKGTQAECSSQNSELDSSKSHASANQESNTQNAFSFHDASANNRNTLNSCNQEDKNDAECFSKLSEVDARKAQTSASQEKHKKAEHSSQDMSAETSNSHSSVDQKKKNQFVCSSQLTSTNTSELCSSENQKEESQDKHFAQDIDTGSSNSSKDASKSQQVSEHICKYCHIGFKWYSELLFHHTSAHQDVVFCCRVCFKIFYDDKEEFKKHVKSHSKTVEAESSQTVHENTLSTEISSNETTADCPGTSSPPPFTADKVIRMDYICKYCSSRYSKLSELFSHQTQDHSDVVFRCKYCCKIVYENEDFFNKHQNSHETHKIHKNRNSKHERSSENTQGQGIEEKSTYSSLSDEQLKWVNKILSVKPGFKRSNSTSGHNIGNAGKPFSYSMLFKKSKAYSCQPCGLEFKSNKEREVHRLFQHRLKLPCRFCPRTLAYKSQLFDHEASHFKKPKIKCRKCGEEFDNSESLNEHKSSHCMSLRLPEYSCQICKRLYVREDELRNHMDTHFDERPFLCEKCGECFRGSADLTLHQNEPCAPRPYMRSYVCGVCERKFHSAGQLERHHQRLHQDVFPCALCGVLLKSRSELASHIGTHDEIRCLVCKEVFDSMQLLLDHLRECHPEESKAEFAVYEVGGAQSVNKLRCDECEKCFVSKLTLQAHKLTHLSREQWKCHHCDKTFTSKSTLENHHMATHPNERPHICVTCSRTFMLEESLLQHEKIHSQVKVHTCKECGKSFPTSLGLSAHMAVHLSGHTFTCNFCSMTFSRKVSLLIHQRSHTSKVYSCSFCPENFSQLWLAEQHERTHLKEQKKSSTFYKSMDEDNCAASLLDISGVPIEVSSVETFVREEVISTVNMSSYGQVDRRKIIVPEEPMGATDYAEVIYVSTTLDNSL